MPGEKRKIKITKAGAHKIAVYNIIFMTLVSMGCWMGPLLCKTWHVKRFYVALGSVAAIKIKFGLWGYDADFGCDNNSWEWSKNLCRKVGGDGENGDHSYYDLQDWLCNAEQASRGILFRGCADVQSLNFGSMGTGIILGISLWLMIMGTAMCCLYFFAGMASKKVYNWMKAFFIAAPALQFTALVLYVMLTHDMDRFLDPGFINRLPGGKALVGSPTGTITFNHSFIGAFCCFLVSCSPLICLHFTSRDKELEAEYEGLDYDEYGGYGATGEESEWGAHDHPNLADQSQQSGYDQTGQTGYDQTGQAGYDPNVHYNQQQNSGMAY